MTVYATRIILGNTQTCALYLKRTATRQLPPLATNNTYGTNRHKHYPRQCSETERLTYVPYFKRTTARQLPPPATNNTYGTNRHKYYPRQCSEAERLASVLYFNVIAFKATITVDNDITTAPTAGLNTNPTPAKIPAANGIAKILYPAPHQRFSTILRYVL